MDCAFTCICLRRPCCCASTSQAVVNVSAEPSSCQPEDVQSASTSSRACSQKPRTGEKSLCDKLSASAAMSSILKMRATEEIRTYSSTRAMIRAQACPFSFCSPVYLILCVAIGSFVILLEATTRKMCVLRSLEIHMRLQQTMTNK